jgi:mannose/fructose-specific phosphotransferase system component IIA
MSEPLKGVVVTHSHMAAALVEAVEAIAGDTGPFLAISNIGATRESLCEDIAIAVGEGPAVVFVDMPGGSCLHATLMELKDRPNVAVVAGVNLPMLLEFAFHRDLPADEAAERAASAGERAIRAMHT